MPQGYNCFRKDHKAGGGRVMIAIKSCYPASDVESNSELVCTSISMRGERKTVIGSFYRPPDQGQEPLDDLDKALKDLSRKYKNQNTTLIIGGDFNTGCINWEILPGCPNIAVHEKLVSILADHHLYQMQRLPTLLDRILDLFCVNKPGILRYTTTIPGISDHEIIVTDMDLKPQYSKKKPHKVYVYSKADFESIRSDINKIGAKTDDNSFKLNWYVIL